MDQTNPPVVKNPLLKQAIRYKALCEAGYTIKPSDVPAPVMEAHLVLESKINEYEKQEQKKIEQKMRSQANGI